MQTVSLHLRGERALQTHARRTGACWITHALWAVHETGLDLWLKGGTSLSKGFGIIERFSEDLDLMVERGSVAATCG
ncbi:MAG: nucleotidyl transferase AbiEii/AbiGii toxin family protein [Planctomycetia bacterium]